MDFSAWFEVFLDGRWYTFDARHNVPRIGRIVIARGSALERRLRPVHTSDGYRYVIAPVASDEAVLVQQGGGGAGFQPSSGGGTAHMSTFGEPMPAASTSTRWVTRSGA